MYVEHRLGVRHTIELDVIVDHHHSGILAGQAQNISIDGIFLRPEKGRIPIHARVNVTFELNGQQFRRQGLVVRSSTDGIGIMFDKRTPEVLSFLNPPMLN